MSNLYATELQGKIQQFEADNKVFLHEQQIQCLASLMELESEGASKPCQRQVSAPLFQQGCVADMILRAVVFWICMAEPGAGEKSTCLLRQLPSFLQTVREISEEGSCFQFDLKAFIGRKHAAELS